MSGRVGVSHVGVPHVGVSHVGVSHVGGARRAVLGMLLCGGALVPPRSAHAQLSKVTTGDSAQSDGLTAGAGARVVIARARALVESGKSVAARALLDSLVVAAAQEPGDLADALYWRAVLGDRVADAERDWKRIIVDVPLSPRVPTALLRLGELEMVRGHPASSRSYLERLLRDYAGARERPKALLWVVRSYFDEREVARACRTLGTLSGSEVPAGELQLQAEELRARCTREGARSTTASASAVPVAATPTPRSGTATDGPKKSSASGTGRFSVQIAAYEERGPAERASSRMTARGLDAHVDGDAAPFRVRIGHFETRAQAQAALERLRAQGQSGFIVVLKP